LQEGWQHPAGQDARCRLVAGRPRSGHQPAQLVGGPVGTEQVETQGGVAVLVQVVVRHHRRGAQDHQPSAPARVADGHRRDVVAAVTTCPAVGPVRAATDEHVAGRDRRRVAAAGRPHLGELDGSGPDVVGHRRQPVAGRADQHDRARARLTESPRRRVVEQPGNRHQDGHARVHSGCRRAGVGDPVDADATVAEQDGQRLAAVGIRRPRVQPAVCPARAGDTDRDRDDHDRHERDHDDPVPAPQRGQRRPRHGRRDRLDRLADRLPDPGLLGRRWRRLHGHRGT
jgi:hypothetical protein